jgi:hypothetical protein
MPHRIAALAALLALSPLAGSQTILRSTTQEVLVDFVARDKHHKLVTDLRPEEIEILEDGVPQEYAASSTAADRASLPKQSQLHRQPAAAPERTTARFTRSTWCPLSLKGWARKAEG